MCACTTVEILTSSFDGFQYMGSFGMIRENSAILFDVNAVRLASNLRSACVFTEVTLIALGMGGGSFH